MICILFKVNSNQRDTQMVEGIKKAEEHIPKFFSQYDKKMIKDSIKIVQNMVFARFQLK